MIPRLTNNTLLEPHYQAFLNALRASRYRGDIEEGLADRIVMATDNSIYQLTPKLVLYPRSSSDVVAILSLAPGYPLVHFAPRGGGTGTDGQALTDGVIIDCSKYMRKIIEINPEQRLARVEPGVVLDDLQAALKPYGLYFPVNISTSNRATLGGMVSTDACGKGSLQHGRTSAHVLACQMILSDGSLCDTRHHSYGARLEALCRPHAALIQEKYPAMPRHVTGYNLAGNLVALIAGAEGTLGVLTEITLQLKPVPAHKQLLLAQYNSFDAALREAAAFTALMPTAIEVMDDTLTALMREDPLYALLKQVIQETTKTIMLMEFEHEETLVLESIVQQAEQRFTGRYDRITDNAMVEALWQCRKKSVGLLGKSDSYERPIPFVEDASVHPKDLADFICDFRAILDANHLHYGMFGHADAGCIHVRPALNLLQAQDRSLMVKLSQDIFDLTKRYHGVLWGEHGLGFRSAYNPVYFGETLYHVFRQIKTLFDPTNQLNPGKIATPLGVKDRLYAVDGPLRAEHDRAIPLDKTTEFSKSLHCNGNGLCFNESKTSLMCPSYKITRQRKHSPKGRAALLRAWLSYLGDYVFDRPYKNNLIKRIFNTLARKPDFSHDVFHALEGCVGCKACKNECPIQVSIPDMKSSFLFHYYQRYVRPLSHFFIAHMETLSAMFSHCPALWQALSAGCQPVLGLCDAPALSTPRLCKALGNLYVSDQAALHVPAERAVFLIQDVFTRFYDTSIVIALNAFLKRLGYTLHILPFSPNGKAQHVLGYRPQFEKIAGKNIDRLKRIAATGIPMISLEPSIALTYRDEYRALDADTPPVLLLQEWLATLPEKIALHSEHAYYLLSHCTEKTASLENATLWKSVFARFGLSLTLLNTGCCGMAGAYGLLRKNKDNSQKIYDLEWADVIKTIPHHTLLATGFSCRHQVKRFSDLTLKHPIEALAALQEQTRLTS